MSVWVLIFVPAAHCLTALLDDSRREEALLEVAVDELVDLA